MSADQVIIGADGEPSAANGYCGQLTLRFVGFTWLNRSASIGVLQFKYRMPSAIWSGRALVGPDGCEYLSITTPGQHSRLVPHRDGEVSRACIDFMLDVANDHTDTKPC